MRELGGLSSPAQQCTMSGLGLELVVHTGVKACYGELFGLVLLYAAIQTRCLKMEAKAVANRVVTRSGATNDARNAHWFRRSTTTATTWPLGAKQDTKRWKDGYDTREAGAVPASSD